MSQRIVLSLCDRTGNILKPWAAAGFRCIAVDTQHKGVEVREGIEYTYGDVRTYMPPRGDYAFVSAFTPCTHMAVSGARWFTAKGMKAIIEALQIAEACREICEWTGAPGFLENPVSTLSTYWRKPDYTFDPCDYGDPYTKKTCLWAFGSFVMPPKNRVEPTEGSKMHTLSPTDDRADLRSETPMGFSRAVFYANCPTYDAAPQPSESVAGEKGGKK